MREYYLGGACAAGRRASSLHGKNLVFALDNA